MKIDMLSEVKAGDAVSINNIEGVVVFSSISNTFSSEFPKSKWLGYNGVMIQQENGALVFHDTEYLQTHNCRIERHTSDAFDQSR